TSVALAHLLCHPANPLGPSNRIPDAAPPLEGRGGSSVHNCQLSLTPPRHSNMSNTENKGTQASTVIAPVTMLRSVLSRARRSLRACCHWGGLPSWTPGGTATCLTTSSPAHGL